MLNPTYNPKSNPVHILINIYLKSIMAGILISIGGIVNLSVENRYVGSLLFSIGLFAILQFKFLLYTGKVGYAVEKNLNYTFKIIHILIGNIIGTGIAAFLIHFTRNGTNIQNHANSIMETKMSDSCISWLILGYFCGMLMYIAVENNRMCREQNNDVSCVFGTVIPVMVFILCGYNHSVADSFYYFAAIPNIEGIPYLITVIIGNALGGLTIPILNKLKRPV